MKPDTAPATRNAPSALTLGFYQNPTVPPALALVPPRLAVEPPEFPIGPTGSRLRGDLIYSGRRGMRSFHAQWLWLLVSLLVCVPASIFAGVAGGAAGMLLLALPGLIWLPLICKSYSWRYQVYQYRVDFETGLLSKRKHSVWLWQILNVEYDRSRMGWLTNTAAVQILADKRRGNQDAESASFEIIGLGGASFMEQLWEELVDAALVQRRAIKWWGM